VYSTGLRFDNHNPSGAALDVARFAEFGWRADGTFAASDRWLVEFGGDAQHLAGRHTRSRFLTMPVRPFTENAYDHDSAAQSAYVGVRASVVPRLTVMPGARVDHWALTRSTTASPWLTAEYGLGARTRLRGGTGVYRQFADFEQVYGFNGGGRSLAPERAVHADIGVEQRLSDTTHVTVTVYRRDESRVLAVPGIEPSRTPEGTVVFGQSNAPWTNALDGRARGAEIVLRRDSPSGLSGWAGYAYGRLRYTLPSTGEQFWADADQRHTLSLYGNYRLSSRTGLSLKYRYGSNYPIVGYIGNLPGGPARDIFDDPIYTLVDQRNTLRLPAYSRLDLRGDRAFNWTSRRLVLFVEVTNVFNHENRRSTPYGVDRLGRVFDATETLMPIVPSAGFVLEF
jgi:outer membrane receptor for ferrienterochelin and colicin